MEEVEPWGPDRLADLVAVVDRALPDEGLTPDELLSCCWDDPGVVLGAGTVGAVAAVVRRPPDGGPVGHVRLVAVRPEVRRRGLGRRLLADAHRWCRDAGAAEVRIGADRGLSLWPGVDRRATAAVGLVEAAGYEAVGTSVTVAVPTTFRAPLPAGASVDRVLGDEQRDELLDFVLGHWPWWAELAGLAVAEGTARVARRGGRVAAFGCHSVARAGWVGPTGTAPAHRGGGLGAALLAAACEDLMVASVRSAEVPRAGTGGPDAPGATVSRRFVRYRRPLSPPA